MKKILAFAGNNSSPAVNRQFLRYLGGLFREHEIITVDLRDYPLPVYGIDQINNGIPENAYRLLKLIEQYDAYVIAVPEHNGAITPFFKNTMDWMMHARPGVFAGKSVLKIRFTPYMDISGEWPVLIHYEEEQKIKAAIESFENTFLEAV